MTQQEKFEFNHTFQGIELPMGFVAFITFSIQFSTSENSFMHLVLVEEDGWGLELTNTGWEYGKDWNEVWDWGGNNDE